MASTSASVFLFLCTAGHWSAVATTTNTVQNAVTKSHPLAIVVLRVNSIKRVLEVAGFIFRGSSKRFRVPAIFGPCFACPDVLKVRTRQAEWPRKP